ncbi:AMSH-like ubiquitin thioesterase 1 [Abeliophyllum distichum]|uniref:AMSH-like ubiquitin thioesterase 1 n=1 Tax=Abeliophyllum distichum TaxID=126358 RepID=A0ABD1PMQ2_9LAMI
MTTRSSSEATINIESSTKKLVVDNRISLRFYYRIADNILKQADIFREEKNIVDLYVMLLRFSSLVMDTIPRHRDYRASPGSNKVYLKNKLLNAIAELEKLKPAVQLKVQELHSRKQPNVNQNDTWESSLGSPIVKQERWNAYSRTKTSPPVASGLAYQGLKTQHFSFVKPVEEYHRRISPSIPRPKDETLARHSILGPSGLHGHWQPPSNHKIQYPSNLDLTTFQAPSCLEQPFKDGTTMRKDDGNLERERSNLESIVLPEKENQKFQTQELDSLISFETVESLPQEEIIGQPKLPPVLVDVQDLIPRSTPALVSFETVESLPQEEIIRQLTPPPVLADIQDLVPRSTPATERECGMEKSSSAGLDCAEDPLQLHISTELMDCFMKLAKSNTDKNLETCGVLAGSLRNRTFSITALIIPKQESTSDSCQTTNEEEIFEVQDKQSLFPLGWIHTHPTQSCFMSSIDVHTHYSYQVMLPESIAIVMAPRDTSKKHGIFRLTPGGMTVVRLCPKRGFHPHEPPSDGSPIYNHCTDVYMNPSLKVDIIDLR